MKAMKLKPFSDRKDRMTSILFVSMLRKDFMQNLKGVEEPEEKRKIIGEEFNNVYLKKKQRR